MSNKQYVDGMLVTWGSDLFYGRVKSKPGKVKDILKSKQGRPSQYTPASASAVRDQLRATFKKVPEVNVKITGSGKHMKQIKAHFDYISRNGEKSLEDQDGNALTGRDDLLDLRDSWRDGRAVIPSEIGTKREAFNIMLSMPPGTNRMGVHNAVREFAREEFGGRFDYVFASHDDTDHPHAHLVVKAQGNGIRLNPRKNDLQRWRRTFAEKLREHGIEANATTKRSRGVTRHQSKKAVIEAGRAGRSLPRYRDPNDNPSNPMAHKTAETHGKVLRQYRGIAEALQQSPDAEDRKLAVDVVRFVQNMPYELEQAKLRERNPNRPVPRGPSKSDKEPGKDR